MEGTLEGLHLPKKIQKQSVPALTPSSAQTASICPRPTGGITPLMEDVGDLHPVQRQPRFFFFFFFS